MISALPPIRFLPDLRGAPLANRSSCCAALIALLCIFSTQAEAAEISAEHEAFFEAKVRPLLIEKCYKCHSEGQQREGGLLLDRRPGLLQGGDSGPAVVPGKPAQSLLILAVRHDENVSAMPPDGKLSAEQVAVLERWVSWGLPDPRGAAVPKLSDPADHWAFQSPRATLPDVEPDAGGEGLQNWGRGPLDLLMAKPMLAAGVQPSPAAKGQVLLRRIAYDLTGLPPTKEMLGLLDDGGRLTSRDYERVVDQLLASPRFGERWGRYWLDVARYADTKGYVFREDRAYPKAYRYREWVIRSLNQDLPYDQFLMRQLAADQLFPEDPDQLAAMGFLTLGRRFLNNIHDIIDDRIDVLMRGTQGLTVACARCHDHKYDPIPSRDYYSLYSVFWSSDEPKDDLPRRLVDRPKPRDVQVFERGSPGNRGEIAPRGFLSVLNNGEPQPFVNGSGRLELAQAIASAQNPLTARVFANRVWGRLFGQHLVETPSDFGVRTAAPAQLETLDYLSLLLVQRQWSTKSLVREIVLSATYRQSSASRADALAVDPENRLFWRMNRRRLDLESMRDTLLSASGQLDGAQIGGKSEDVVAGGTRRRTIYAHIDRQNLPSLFRIFDFASPDTHNAKRPKTTVPQQSLFLLNSPFVMGLAEQLVDATRDLDDQQRLNELYAAIYARSPTGEERDWTQKLLGGAVQPARGKPPAGWQYGYGNVNDKGKVHFQPLPVFDGNWRGGPKLPDPTLGWVSLTADGGHPGAQNAAIRRWVAPAAWKSAELQVQGVLAHPADQGDGVRGRIISNRQGEVASFEARHRTCPTSLKLTIVGGEIVDFVVDARENPSHDSFQWRVTLTAQVTAKQQASVAKKRWDSRDDFRGHRPEPLDPWAQIAQVMLISNELMFLD